MNGCCLKVSILFALALGGVKTDAHALMTMRLRGNETESVDTWRASFKAVAENPGCCDEIWFATVCGVPEIEKHRANAKVLKVAIADCRAKGIVPSLQFQETIGHGDGAETPKGCEAKKWTGWTGPWGKETKSCNCPRQPEYHEYLRKVSRIYAPLGFGTMWLDDDLRIAYHAPSDSVNRYPGCWCERCLKDFNAANGSSYTRGELVKAIESDKELSAKWREFQIKGLCSVARTIGEVFHELSPETKLCYQHDSSAEVRDVVKAILSTLHEISHQSVGSRPGGSHYYDENPSDMVFKSLRSGKFRALVGNPDYVDIWTPEIESWPRTYYSRSSQGVLVEAFASLMHGMNSISFFISNSAFESPELYGKTHWRTLAKASKELRGYAQAIEGKIPVGYEMNGPVAIGIRRAAIPVLAGWGRKVGTLTEKECALKLNLMKSSEVQKLRNDLDERAGWLPAVIMSPFAGLMQLHETKEGKFAALALLNMSITTQGPIEVKLRHLPPGKGKFVWHELKRGAKTITAERRDDETTVTIPSLGAWNGGYLTVE